MNSSSEHNIPWELIISSLQKDSNAEESAQLKQWISFSDKNGELFERVQKIWREELIDYSTYQAANENAAWDALRSQLGNKEIYENGNRTIVHRSFKGNRVNYLRWLSIAAIFVLVIGTFIWYNVTGKNLVYQTGSNEARSISLADGSSIKLYPNSKIEVSKTYNKSDRAISFVEGEAFFDVKHDDQIPFIVDLGATTVKDIGTSFYIHNTKDSIRMSVKSGEVEFINKQNNETRQLSAGMNLQYQPAKSNSTPTILIDSSEAIANKNQLRFENTVLPDVIMRLQEVYGKKIVLKDSAISQKRFSANLEGQTFDGAMEILSKSLSIKYFVENDVYYLKSE